jgi:hypothetical protein
MEQHSYHVPEHDQPIHVNNTAATAFLGVLLALIACTGCISLANAMHWHVVVGGFLTGLSGVLMGALGTSTVDGNRAAVLGWAGAVNFFLGLILFVITMAGIIK